MKLYPVATLLGVLLLFGLWGGVAVQRRQISELRGQIEHQGDASRPVTIVATGPPNALGIVPLDEAEKIQLLRLRAEVARLRNAKITTPVRRITPGTSQGTNTTVIPLPEGYRPAAQLRYAGFATPESTLESFLWAVRNHDTNVLLQILPPEIAEKFSASLAKGEDNGLFENAGKLPGFRVRSSRMLSDNNAELEIQIDPRSESQAEKTSFERVDGAWKLDFLRW